MMDDFTSYAVIPPPQTKDMEGGTKFTRVVIDSKDRDISLFPNPNTYEITLDDDINDVISAQLIAADVPIPMYIINDYFCKLYVSVGGTSTVVTLDKGDWDNGNTALPFMIETKLNEVFPATFQVEYNANLDNYIFRSTVSFSFDFKTAQNTLHSLLGFRKKVYESVASGQAPYVHVLSSEFRRNFDFNNYVVLYIDQFDLNRSASTITNRSFAVIPKNPYQFLSITDDVKIIKNFTPPIPRLAKIRLHFLDRYGNEYDFQNMDHRLEILFTSYRQRRKYMDIFGQ